MGAACSQLKPRVEASTWGLVGSGVNLPPVPTYRALACIEPWRTWAQLLVDET